MSAADSLAFGRSDGSVASSQCSNNQRCAARGSCKAAVGARSTALPFSGPGATAPASLSSKTAKMCPRSQTSASGHISLSPEPRASGGASSKASSTGTPAPLHWFRHSNEVMGNSALRWKPPSFHRPSCPRTMPAGDMLPNRTPRLCRWPKPKASCWPISATSQGCSPASFALKWASRSVLHGLQRSSLQCMPPMFSIKVA
mmetsp:Transcript_17897/g.56391  ORF Transcript_17897/g.56391 Transcript_17897/m.56391 type:complete len:201 (+) Transcript_17897:415-1017(+)